MADQENARETAIKRLKAKRDFKMHLGAYVIISAMFFGIWALSPQGTLWPLWVSLFWGVGLAFHGWTVYFQKPITEGDIRREMENSL
ncbi:MAG: 2TM domain-containing protein [Rhodospirillales bacterium]|nr:2TM domain-containing protein [Rhodospirillales bacterium]